MMIKKDIFNNDLKEKLKASANDKLFSFLMADGMLRGAVVNTTRMVREMQANHDLGPLETLVLGHAYTAAALITANLKGKDRVSLSINCSGPVKGLDVEANVFGEVRGFLKNPKIAVQDPANLKSVSQLFGAGMLTVTKYLEDAKSPYSGQVALEYGSIAEDLALYFLESEQKPTGFNLGVDFDENEEILGAGGIFLQAMPGADEELLKNAEETLSALSSLGSRFAQEDSCDRVLLKEFESLDPVIIGDRRVAFYCRCSAEKMESYVARLPEADRKDILEKSEFPVEIRCHHCNTVYSFSREDIEKMV